MQRRQILKTLGISAAALSLPTTTHADLLSWFKGNDRPPAPAGKPLEFSRPAARQNNLPLTPEDKVSGYNNFYEFGLDKADPAANAGSLKTDPWTLKISGEVAKPLTLDHDALTRRFPLEERIYRMRCVEAWSMVVPWIGFPLHKLLALAEPTSNAKYVAFETIYAPEQMPGQQDRFIGGGLKYPYIEGLRLDEAMHPLTLMTVGVYGKALPPQNGAPVRLIVPWKYGFKGIKSIVSIKLTRERPPTTGIWLRPMNTAFMPTSIHMLIIPVGRRLPNGLSVQVAFLMYNVSQRCCLTDTPIKWRRFIVDWIYGRISKCD